jgi:hypothetical protein
MLPGEPFLAISNERFEPELNDADCIEIMEGAEERFIVPIRCRPANKLNLT